QRRAERADHARAIRGRELPTSAKVVGWAGPDLRLACPRLPQGPVLPDRGDHVPGSGRPQSPGGPQRSPRHRGGDRAPRRGRGGRRGVHGIIQVTSLGVLVDQLFSPVPGGMGTYVRELVPALSRAEPSLGVTLFHARFEAGIPEPWMQRYAVEELPWSIRRLYPSWAVARRPRLPPPLNSIDVIHSPLPAAVPPKAPGQRLVVTVHDLAFVVHRELYPVQWRLMYRAGLFRAVREADAIIAPSRHTAEDLMRRSRTAGGRVHVVPLAASLPSSTGHIPETLARLKVRAPYVLFVGTLEPRKNIVRLVRAYRRLASRGAPHALVLA